MKRSIKFACTVALMAAPAGTLSAQQAPPNLTPATEAQIAASPAAKRLRDLVDVVNDGDAAAMKAFAQAAGVDPTKPPPGPPGTLPLVGAILDLHRRSQGLELVRVATVEDGRAVAVVRNRLTGDEQGLAVQIEPQAPHRITGLPFVPSAIVAAFAKPAESMPQQSEQAQLKAIESYLKRLGAADIFSGVVLIARDGKPVFAEAYGYADREKKIANTVDTRFNLASINKLFTGLAVGQLVEQGKLSYEDPLSKFMPDFPDPATAKRIKLKHLLSHTSGLGDFFGPAYVQSLDRLRTAQAFIDVAERKPLKFEPGTGASYSNLGYQLLGRIVELASGEDYYDYMQAHVFDPAGMSATSFPHLDRGDLAMAHAYEIEFDGQGLHYVNQLAANPRRGTPAGAGLATAQDFIRLSNALRAGKIVKPETLRLHASPKPALSSPAYGYGFSTMARMAKRPFVGHSGNLAGICTEFGELTDTPYTIVVLSNATISSCIPVTAKILKVLAPTRPPAP